MKTTESTEDTEKTYKACTNQENFDWLSIFAGSTDFDDPCVKVEIEDGSMANFILHWR